MGLNAGTPARPDQTRWMSSSAPHRAGSCTLRTRCGAVTPLRAWRKAAGLDAWFVRELQAIVETERALQRQPIESLSPEGLRRAKRDGFSDQAIAQLCGTDEAAVRAHRAALALAPVFQRVDTCAAEFEAHTPYLYSTYGGTHDEAAPTTRRKALILGSGPNRIGQGIEFDYCCVHACTALREMGIETVMLNCNPETSARL